MHIPVLLSEVLASLSPSSGDRILDVTLGLGGHAEAMLKATGSSGVLVGIDADLQNLERARTRLPSGSTVLVHANFRDVPACLPPEQRVFDVILADLGISSPHLDDASRGFSFRFDAPLDMRLDQSSGQPASIVLSSLDRASLIRIFRDYGEVQRSHRLVDEIISRRKTDPVRTTFALSDAIRKAYGTVAGGDILPQVFQALRIAVNGELDALDTFLREAPRLLGPGGRLGIISFHSLEDRMVKTAFRDLTTAPKDPLTGQDLHPPEFELLTKKGIAPSDGETASNPRARSARLRAIRRLPAYTSLRS